MTPIVIKEPKHKERERMMVEELQAYLDAGCDAAELQMDASVCIGRNVELYKKAARAMQIDIYNNYAIGQYHGNVVIKKTGGRA